jgi:F-type H+-transporting ATPase subunit b
MKAIRIIAPIAAVLHPTLAFAAEQEPGHGSWFALLFYAINFGIFIWLVVHYGGSQISVFFHERARTIRDNRHRVELQFKDAQELANRAVTRLRQLEAEKSQTAAALREETDHEVKAIRKAAEEAVSRFERDATLTITALREGAQRRLRQTMAEGAGCRARELLRLNFEARDQQRLLEGFIEKLGEEAGR